MTIREDAATAGAIVEDDDDDEEFAYERTQEPAPVQQVPAYIAIVRIGNERINFAFG